MGSFDVFERGFELAFNGHILCDLISEWEGSAILITTRPPIPTTPGIMSSARMMAHPRARASRSMLTGLLLPLTRPTTVSRRRPRAAVIFASVRELPANTLTAISTTHLSTGGPFPQKRLKPGSCAGAIPWGRCRRRCRAGSWGCGPSRATARRRLKIGVAMATTPSPTCTPATRRSCPEARAASRRIRGIGGIDCGQAGDFERTDAFSAGGWFCYEGGGQHSLLSKIEPGRLIAATKSSMTARPIAPR